MNNEIKSLLITLGIVVVIVGLMASAYFAPIVIVGLMASAYFTPIVIVIFLILLGIIAIWSIVYDAIGGDKS